MFHTFQPPVPPVLCVIFFLGAPPPATPLTPTVKCLPFKSTLVTSRPVEFVAKTSCISRFCLFFSFPHTHTHTHTHTYAHVCTHRSEYAVVCQSPVVQVESWRFNSVQAGRRWREKALTTWTNWFCSWSDSWWNLYGLMSMSDETWPWYALQTKQTQAVDQISQLQYHVEGATIKTCIYEDTNYLSHTRL